MFEWLTPAIAAAQDRYRFSLNPPAAEQELIAVEQRLGLGLPASFRQFLLTRGNGGILFHTEADTHSPVSLHIYGTSTSVYGTFDLLQETLTLRETYAEEAEGLVLFGYTPGPGAFYLALDAKTGEVLDLYGVRRRDWNVIAPSFEAFLQKTFKNLEQPLYWL